MNASPSVSEVIPGALDGERVDRTVAFLTGLTRAEVAALVEAGGVRLDGRVVRVRSRRVHTGQRLDVDRTFAPEPDAALEGDAGVAFKVVFADEQLIVIDKPAGLVVHPGAGHLGGTLVQGLLARYPDLA
jgi:23S rRNA pseudouridine1911/1915/1917 synthase